MNFRAVALIALGGISALAACSASSVQDTPSPRAQRELADALQGRTPGPAVRCLPNYRADNMQVIDDSTILFRDGRTVYVNTTLGACNNLANPSYALVTRNFGSQLCRGDIATVADMTSGMTVGSCALGDFVPYRAAP